MDQITPKQMAIGIGVSEATIKRWCDQGKIETLKTAGGHRRIPMHAVISFLKNTGREVVKPEVFNLPLHTGKTDASLKRVSQDMIKTLEDGDYHGFKRLVYNLVLSSRSISEICDDAITPAFVEIGELWHRDEIEVYQERRACQICTRVIYDLYRTIPEPKPGAPIAIGGTLSNENYELATLMIELCLQEAGWNAKNLGCNLPLATYLKAVDDLKPKLIWLSVSHPSSNEDFLKDYTAIYEKSQESNIPIAVGGQALRRDVRSQMQYSTFCDQIHHLIDFARMLEKK